MLRVIVEGFILGLMTSPVCAMTCAPVFLSFTLSGDEKGLGAQGRALVQFLAGRLAGYAAIGLIFGWVGSHVAAGAPPLLVAVTQGALGVALLFYALSKTKHSGFLCGVVGRWGLEKRYPLVLGLLSGLTICPPFLLAVGRVTQVGGALLGGCFFVAFFFGTSLILAPMVFVSLANLLKPVQSLARVGCAAVGVLCLCAAAASAGEMAGLRQGSAAGVRFSAPEMEAVEKQEPMPHRVLLEGGRPVGIIALSMDFAPEVKGYGGHVPLAVTMNFSGKITNVILLPGHDEAPAFYDKVKQSELLKELKGKNLSDAIETGKDVDGVSGATHTSEAVVDATRLTARRAAEKLFPLYGHDVSVQSPGAAGAASEATVPFRFNPWHLGIVVLSILAILARWRGAAWMRYALLAVSFFWLGVWQKAFFSVQQLTDVFVMRPFSWPTHAGWYIIMACALGTALATGRVYCAYVCPFGAVQEFLAILFRNPLRISMKWDLRLRRVKYYVLLAALLVYAATRNGGVLLGEPFGETFSLGFLGAGGGVAMRAGWIVFLLVAAALVRRFFCRFLCPAGAAMGFLAQHRLSDKERSANCAECGDCLVSCAKRGGQP